MFTGLVEEVGILRASQAIQDGLSLEIAAPAISRKLSLGDSVSCNGVCLTVTKILHKGSQSQGSQPEGFQVHAVSETLQKTGLGKLHQGDAINLEAALSVGAPMGGHYVQGHVDGIGQVKGIETLGDQSREISIRIPKDLARYCVSKGSIAINGVSLTVAAIEECNIKECNIKIALIPHTLKHTNLNALTLNSDVNIEVDILAKYVEKSVAAFLNTGDPDLSKQLQSWGYHV